MKKLSSFFKKIQKTPKTKGFTLIEILVVIGIIAVLAAIVIVAINPARQFAQARNTQRTSNVETILNAIGQNLADNKGIFTCPGTVVTSTATNIGDGGSDVDLMCLIPTYISTAIPVDPSTGTNTCTISGDNDCNDAGESYDSDYTVEVNTGRYTVCAPGGAESALAGSTAICLTR